MAPSSQEDECPVCQSMLPQITGGSKGAKESHVQSCIGSGPSAIKIPQQIPTRESGEGGDSCPICHSSYLTECFANSDAAREAHFIACFESQSSSSKATPLPVSPPSYNRAATNDYKLMPPEVGLQTGKGAASRLEAIPSTSAAIPTQLPVPAETTSNGPRRFSIFGFGGGKTKEQKLEEKITKVDGLVLQRWGPLGSPTSEMIRRYWMATRMEQHWEYLRAQHPKQFKKYLQKGYMEPIPVCTVSQQSSPLGILI